MIQEKALKQADFANFFVKMTACFGDLSEFEQKIQQIADLAGISLTDFQLDHAAIRMNSTEKAGTWRSLLLEGATLLKESEVNGRPIGLFELHQPIRLCGQTVSVIELPFPKGKIYQQEGWEHVEIVLPIYVGESVDQWIARIVSEYDLDKKEAIELKISQPAISGEALPNPTIAVTVRNATYCNYACLKLHPYDIKDIILSEHLL